jgi:putative FmdB family regulatory protein
LFFSDRWEPLLELRASLPEAAATGGAEGYRHQCSAFAIDETNREALSMQALFQPPLRNQLEHAMPIYGYECNKCGHQFETLVRTSDTPACPECESVELTRQLSLIAPPNKGGNAVNAAPAACGGGGGCPACPALRE